MGVRYGVAELDKSVLPLSSPNATAQVNDGTATKWDMTLLLSIISGRLPLTQVVKRVMHIL